MDYIYLVSFEQCLCTGNVVRKFLARDLKIHTYNSCIEVWNLKKIVPKLTGFIIEIGKKKSPTSCFIPAIHCIRSR